MHMMCDFVQMKPDAFVWRRRLPMAHEIEAYRCVTCARESRDGVVVHVGIGHESVDEEDGSTFLWIFGCWGVEQDGVGNSVEEDLGS